MSSIHVYSLLHYKVLVKHSVSKQDLHLGIILALIAYYFFKYDYSTVLTPYPLCEY